FVTHDQIEALTMADRIAVLHGGHILQIGTPFDIYDRPATTVVAQLVGTPKINLFTAHRQNGHLQVVDSPLMMPTPIGDIPDSVLLGVRPENVKLTTDGQYTGKVALIEPLGVETIIHIRVGDQTIVSIVPGASPVRLGDTIRFDVPSEQLHLFEPTSKLRI
ncbi:MAG: TOBE domain-containing protein, partial [Chloroflexota bacterium]